MENLLHTRLEDHLHDRLRHAVSDRRDAEGTLAAVVLRDLYELHGRWEVRARRHPIPDLVEIPPSGPSRTPPVTAHPLPQPRSFAFTPLIRVPDELLRNFVGLATGRSSSHCWLTTPRSQDVGPSLRPRYQASYATSSPSAPAPRIGTRLLAGLPLGGLPWHRSAGSRVPHESLRWAHAVLVPATIRAASRPSPDSSQANDRSLVSMASLRFRHVNDGSLTLVFPALT